MTANTELFDAALRHQVALRRYTSDVLQRMIKLLEVADRDLAGKLRQRLTSVRTKRELTQLLAEVRALRKATVAQLQEEFEDELTELVVLEAAHEERIIKSSVPVELVLASPSLTRVEALVRNDLFYGQKLRDWFRDLRDQDRSRLDREIALGIMNGEDVDTMVRRIIGNRSTNYSDGVLSTTRQHAQVLVRTAVNHASNSARELVWEANADVVWALRWTSTLDGRTSLICIARDGDYAMVGGEPMEGVPLLAPQDARPPAHPNCRSLMVAVLSPEGVVGNRASVSDTRDRRRRDIDFRAEARAEAGDKWRGMSRKQRDDLIRRKRSAWAQENIGQQPAGTTYEQWLKRQSNDFQDAVLGLTKAKLWRNGSVTADDFIDAGGRTRSLSELDQLMKRRRKR